MSRWTLGLAGSGFLAVGALLAAAQDAPAPSDPPSKSAPAVREEVVVHLVQMPLIATDRQGRPIRDLKAEELEVKFGGRRVPVSFLEPARSASPTDAPVEGVRLYLDAPGGWGEPAKSSTLQPRYMVVFVDIDNDSPLGRNESAERAIGFLRSSLDAATFVSVFSYDGELHQDLPFSADRNAMETAIRSAVARPGRPRLDPRNRMQRLLRSMQACVRSSSQFDKQADPQCLRDLANEYQGEVNPRAEEYIGALKSIVDYLSGLEGRKSVIALSHGIPIDASPVLTAAASALFGPEMMTDFQRYIGFGSSPRAQMDALLKELVRARVSLSFVDRVAAPTDDFQASRGEMLSEGAAPSRAEYDATEADLTEMAATSGGTFRHSSDVTVGLRQTLDMLDGSYDLGFDLDEYVSAKSLEKIKVSCTRKGVKLVYARGVYVPKTQSTAVLKGHFVLSKPTPQGQPPSRILRQPFRLEIDPKGIGYKANGNEMAATFTIHLSILSPSSGRLADTFHFVSHSYEAALWKKGEISPVTFTGWAEAPPGSYVLRAWVRNNDTGQEGAITGPIEIVPR